LDISSSYDEVLYPSYVHAQTHPDRLATIAFLFGMKPVPVPQSRILELGCGQGSNLIPLAVSYPHSQCVGIDLSARQVAEGLKVIAELQLKNIELRAQSILDFPLDDGKFDYIIAHGVYSWVPEPVRHKILQIARDHLSDQGVVFVSYNTYPGWHQRRMIRDMMCYHTRSFVEPQKRIQQAKAFLTFMTKAVPEESAYGRSLHEEYRSLSNVDESYIFHEQLEEVNEPIYFHQFADLAKGQGLQYVNEIELSNLRLDRYPQQVAQVLADLEVVEREQYLDFLTRRTFRQTLLCHQEVMLDRDGMADRILQMRIASPVFVGRMPDASAIGKSMVLDGPGGAKLTISDPMLQIALVLLAKAWPGSIPFGELLASVRRELSMGRLVVQSQDEFDRDAKSLAHSLAHCCVIGVGQLHVTEPTFSLAVQDKPKACPLARLQAASGASVTSRLHTPVELDPIGRKLLTLLDGTADEAELLKELTRYVNEQGITLQQDGNRITDPTILQESLHKAIGSSLDQLRRRALLVD
jgi:cyclopropane fatty-acyl-phospholipid synthase-like methyltransferase